MDRRLHQGQSPDNHWTSTFAQQVWRRAPPRKKTSLDDFHENFRRNSEVHRESALWPGEDIIKVLKRSSKVGRGVAVTPAALLPALLGAKVHHLLHHTGQPFYTVGAHIWLLSLTDRNTGHFHPVPTKTAILPEEHLLQLCLQTNMNQYEPDKLLCTLQSSAQVLCLF